ncbi:MAG: hypothetical protein WC732_01510 [Candidatus Omnitrophota bacterium]
MNRKGQALIVSYLVVVSFLVYAASLLTKAISEQNIAERSRLTAETFYMAEGATEAAIAAFAADLANFVITSDTQTYTTTTTFASLGNATVNSTISRLEQNERLVTEGDTKIYVCNYEIVSTASHPSNSDITVTVHQIIARRLIPTFQHAVFYNDDLEILPGAAMTLSGRIHSNEDIYVHSRDTLTIDSFYFRSAGEILNRRKDDPEDPMGGTVNIRENKPGSPQYEAMDGLDSSDAGWLADSTERWNGTVQSASHGVTNLTTPAVGSIQPSGYYASRANVVITDNTIVKNGVALAEGTDYPAGTITSTTSFYNNREGKYVKMSKVDLEKLSGRSGTCDGSACPNNLPSNGLMYVTRTDAGSFEPGVELVNGSQIDRNAGLTVVSNQPVYVKGNYNTVSEKPTAIIADALNLLSNNWNDSNSTSSVNSRIANATTINCAFVAGVEPSSEGSYNGGLENYPRLHEKWSGTALTIKGSFVELWESHVASGAWQYGEPQYTAPNRNWSYNTSYNTLANLPPFTPMAVEARRLAWWQD